MLRDGPISLWLHGILDYGLAALLIVAPFIFTFSDEGAPTAVSIIAGVLVLIAAATTVGFPTALVKALPAALHLGGDLVLGAVFIAAPFLFAFSGDSGPTAFFIVVGVVMLLLTIATRWRPPA